MVQLNENLQQLNEELTNKDKEMNEIIKKISSSEESYSVLKIKHDTL